jgi:hypothetical protein
MISSEVANDVAIAMKAVRPVTFLRVTFLRVTQKAWEAFRAKGLHVTANEADACIARLEQGHDVEPPEFKPESVLVDFTYITEGNHITIPGKM